MPPQGDAQKTNQLTSANAKDREWDLEQPLYTQRIFSFLFIYEKQHMFWRPLYVYYT